MPLGKFKKKGALNGRKGQFLFVRFALLSCACINRIIASCEALVCAMGSDGFSSCKGVGGSSVCPFSDGVCVCVLGRIDCKNCSMPNGSTIKNTSKEKIR